MSRARSTAGTELEVLLVDPYLPRVERDSVQQVVHQRVMCAICRSSTSRSRRNTSGLPSSGRARSTLAPADSQLVAEHGQELILHRAVRLFRGGKRGIGASQLLVAFSGPSFEERGGGGDRLLQPLGLHRVRGSPHQGPPLDDRQSSGRRGVEVGQRDAATRTLPPEDLQA